LLVPYRRPSDLTATAKALVLMARSLTLPARYLTPEQVAALTRQVDEMEGADLIVVGGRQPGGEYPVFGSTAVRVMRPPPARSSRCPDGSESCSCERAPSSVRR